MPIKGLTDRIEAAFPRIGKLRKGSAAPRNQKGDIVGIGKDQEFFRFTSERPEVAAAFEEAYGEKPALVSVYLPYTDVERNFACWKEKWTAGGLVHRCDGETMTVWLDQAGKYQRTPRACDGGCDEVGRLTVIVPELVRAGYVGYVTLETHGINDVLSIQASLMAAWETRAGNPLGLRGIQWSLRRVKEKISTPAPNGKRARREKWLVKLEPAADWVQLQLQAAHNATMMLPAWRGQPVTQEPATDERIDPDTGEIGEPLPRDLRAERESPPGDEAPAAYEVDPEGPDPAQAFHEAIIKLAFPLAEAAQAWRVQMDDARSLEELAEVHKRLNANRASVRAALPALVAYLTASKATLELEEAAGEPPDEDAMASLFPSGK